VNPYPDPESRRPKMTHKIRKKLIELSYLEVLDNFFLGLKASLLAWKSFMEAKG
jgi:hypothetical protein